MWFKGELMIKKWIWFLVRPLIFIGLALLVLSLLAKYGDVDTMFPVLLFFIALALDKIYTDMFKK